MKKILNLFSIKVCRIKINYLSLFQVINQINTNNMNAQDFFERMMLEQLTAKAKAELNKGMKKPFEVLVNLVKVEDKGIKVCQAMVCNN